MRVNLPARAASAEARRERTRLKLLEAATLVIAEKGVEGVSIEDLRGAAGVSRGTFYNYFPTVDGLVEALASHVVEAVAGDVDVMLAGPAGPVVRMAGLAHYFIELSVRDPAFGWIVLRLVGSKARRTAILEGRFDLVFTQAVAASMFRRCDLLSARTLGFGAVRLAMRDILADEAPPDHGLNVVALMLAAYGVAAEEAEAASRQGQALAIASMTRF